MMRRSAAFRFVLGFVLLAVLPDTGTAQVDDAPSYSSSFVPRGHWSEAAVRRLAGLGLAPGYDLSMRLPGQRVLGDLFAEAAARADRDQTLDGDLHELIEAWDRRFRHEFAIDGSRAAFSPLFAGSSASAGYLRATGRLESGWGYEDGDPTEAIWHAPTAAPDLNGLLLDGRVQASPFERLSLAAAASLAAGDGFVDELYVAGAAGPATVWLGRRDIAYGPGTDAIVIRDARVDGIGVQTSAFRLPWLLRHAGPVHAAFTLGRTDLERSYDDVYFLTTRTSVIPHPRLTLGVSRGAFFGGDGNGDVDAFDVFSVLIGKHAGEVASELDNQVVAVDVDFRPPTDPWLPLRMYLEWGFEDSAGAWRSVPGVLAGIEVSMVPFLPMLALRVERTSFAHSCCANPAWYRHSNYQDGWTQDAVPIGHTLGGHGEEWAIGADVDLVAVRARVRGYSRWRGDENLYAPDREGDSIGMTGDLELDAGANLRIRLEGALEDGAGWRESRLSVGLRALL